MTTIVISVDGVMTEHPKSDSILNYEASGPGRVLYDMVKQSCRIVFLASDPYEDRVRSWLIRERFSKFAGLYCHPLDSTETAEEWKVSKTLDLLGVGHHLAFFLSTEPETVKAVLNSGVNAMLVTYTGRTPGQSPYGISDTYAPWDTLVESIEEQAMLKSAKAAKDEEHVSP